ncbi:hypothetical protein [Facilibium subflavum]|uniref:hypothetical protein n=1 Tax=Facilibium subflavum TaxID=2219058 RepID=UPI0013C30E3A|nr:hypothetical protein [Facilibium subflavum]
MWYITIAVMLAVSLYVGYRFTLYVDRKISNNRYLEVSDDPNHPANQLVKADENLKKQ